MTQAIHLTDLHIDDYKPFSSNCDRLENCLKVVDDVYKSAAKRGINTVLFAGDLFNTPKFLYTKVLTKTLARFDRHVREQPEVVWYAITGNHDFATKNLLHKPAVSALEHLATAFPDNFKVIDNLVQPVSENAWVCGIPNYEFKEHFQKCLLDMSLTAQGHKNRNPNLKVTLMIHQSPVGQYNANVRTQTHPDDPLYESFDMVLCGDIHTSQRINEKFLISGNPLHQSLSDEGKEKGFWILDLEEPTNVKFVSRKGRYPEFKRVKQGKIIADSDEHFIIQEAVAPTVSSESDVQMLDKFGSSLPHEQLLKNFWLSTEGKDQELLEMGISFLPK